VAHTYGQSSSMEKTLKNQILSDPRNKNIYLNQKKILEINPKHPIVMKLLDIVTENKQDTKSEDIVKVLFESASLSSGYSIDDPSELTTRVYRLLAQSLNVNEEVELEEEVIPEPEDTPISKDDHIGQDHDDL